MEVTIKQKQNRYCYSYVFYLPLQAQRILYNERRYYRTMIIVNVKEGESLDRALKRFKKKFEKTGVLRELRSRQAYEKKSVTRRIQVKKAIYKQALQREEA